MNKVAVSSIRVEGQQRRELGDLSGLKRSIEANGLVQPLVLRQEGDQYVLVAGHRRLQCVSELGWQEVEAVCQERDAARVAMAQFAENFEREDLPVADVAGAVQQMIDLGVDVPAVTSLTAQQVGQYRTFNGLDSKLQEAVLEHRISQDDAKTAQKGLQKYPQHRERILAGLWQARWILQTIEREERAAKAHAAALKKATKIGLQMAVDGETFAPLVEPEKDQIRWGKVAMEVEAHRELACHRGQIDRSGQLVEGCNDPTNHGDLFEGRVLESEMTSSRPSGAEKGAQTRARNKALREGLPQYEESVKGIFAACSKDEAVTYMAEHLVRHLHSGEQDAAAALAGCENWEALVKEHGIEKAAMAALWARANGWVIDTKRLTMGAFRLTTDSEDLLAFWTSLAQHGRTEDARVEGSVRKAYGRDLSPRQHDDGESEGQDLEEVA